MKHKREHWGSRLGFVLAAIGSAIGLGTLWQFPYVTGENGGGLFVLIYLIFTVVIGMPVFIGELILGRRAQRGVVGIFASLSHSRNWRLVGWLAFISPLVILSYYAVVAGWGLNYIFLSLDQFWVGRTQPEIAGVFDAMFSSGDVCILFQFLFTLIVVGVVYQGIQKGIEYYSKLMTIMLFIIVGGLFIYGCTLPGFGQAVRFVLSFDVSNMRPSSVLQALGLAFFTLSLGQGIMLTYGSYMEKSADIPKTALIVVVADVVVSVLAALMIFPIVFSFGFEPDQEAGLIFRTLPVLFSQLFGSLMISVLFFALFTFAALTSAIAMLEVMVANLCDLYSWSRKRATLVSGLAAFVIGIPSALSGSGALFPQWQEMYGMTWFETMNALVSIWLLPILGLLTAIFVGWALKADVIREEFSAGTKWQSFFQVWRFFVRYVVPIGIILIILQQSGLIDVDTIFGGR